jgi:hypothetical protein
VTPLKAFALYESRIIFIRHWSFNKAMDKLGAKVDYFDFGPTAADAGSF